MGMSFQFVDLFSGIGGFHAALSMMGGECVLASEVDVAASQIYARNWLGPGNSDDVLSGDINDIAPATGLVLAPDHDILTAGFPCQPFSKSGAQQGTRDRVRGTLYFNILRIVEQRKPPVLLLENVRNLAGPRHTETWSTIIQTLRSAGYKVSDTPAVMSPHLLPPNLGGTPQVRDRVFIAAIYVGKRRAKRETDIEPIVRRRPIEGWDPAEWNLESTPLLATGSKPLLQRENQIASTQRNNLTTAEIRWIDAWDDFVARMWEARDGMRLPGFPLWVDSWIRLDRLRIPKGTPEWKKTFLLKNSQFYTDHQEAIDAWLEDWDGLTDFPPSRRKFEWQAQETARLWDCVIHFRPSGLRAKRPNYLPALVAISQTPAVGSRRRKITVREAARLQGFPDAFSFGDQSDSTTFMQLGNGVAVGVVYYVLRKFLQANTDDLPDHLGRVSEQLPTIPDYRRLEARLTHVKRS